MPFLECGQDKGGQAVKEVPDGLIVPATIPVDQYGNPAGEATGIPDPDGVVNLAIGASSSRVAFPSGATRGMLYATVGFYYKFGNNTVVADTNSSQLPAGTGNFPVGSYTHIAVLQISSGGNLNITKMD